MRSSGRLLTARLITGAGLAAVVAGLMAPGMAAMSNDTGSVDPAPASAGPSRSAVAPTTATPGWRLIGIQSPAPAVRLIPDPRLSPAARPAMKTAAASSSWRPSSSSEPPDGYGQAQVTVQQAPGDAQGISAPTSGPSRPDGLPADAQAVAAARVVRPYLLTPSLSGALPSGYAGSWGDYYVAGSAGTPGNLRDGVADGSINLGFGLGDPVRYLGMTVNWGIGSIKRFNGNGSLGFAVSRILVNSPTLQIAAAGGMIDAYSYGYEQGKPQPNGYGALSVTFALRPGDQIFPQRLQFTVGGGGNSFSSINGDFVTNTTGYFGSVGLEVTPYLGLSVGQSSRSTNVNVSLIPFPTVPIFVNLTGGDLFGNTPWGTVGVLTIGWGDNLTRGFMNQ